MTPAHLWHPGIEPWASTLKKQPGNRCSGPALQGVGYPTLKASWHTSFTLKPPCSFPAQWPVPRGQEEPPTSSGLPSFPKVLPAQETLHSLPIHPTPFCCQLPHQWESESQPHSNLFKNCFGRQPWEGVQKPSRLELQVPLYLAASYPVREPTHPPCAETQCQALSGGLWLMCLVTLFTGEKLTWL